MNQEKYYEEKAAYELLEKYKDIGKKLMIIFWIMLVSNILSAVNLGIEILATILRNAGLKENLGLISAILGCIAAFAIGVIIFTMRQYDEQLGIAGMTFLFSQVISSISAYLSNSCFESVLTLAASVMGIIYIIKYTKALSALTYNISCRIADNWELLRKVYLGGLVTAVVCSFLLIVPGINILAAIIIAIVMLVMLVISIWQMVLVFQTSRAMSKYELQLPEQ